MANRRHNIGLLVATITDEFSNRLTIGAMEAAKQLDVNLVIFPGKYVGVQDVNEMHGAKYEYQYNVLFDLAAEAKLDYLIAAVGTIGFVYDHEGQMRFLDSLGDTPILSVAAESERYAFLQFDDCPGLVEAVDYLVAHGRKHIGMMVGNLNNEVYVRRYRAYRQRLEDHGLAFKDSYIMPSNLAVHCFQDIEALLDQNPELDAILCTTDIIAADVCQVLKQRGIRIGTDVAVVGFDDLPIDAELDPPLASVRADAVQLGRRAVEKAVNALNGVEDTESYLATRFIPRRSCFKYVGDADVTEKIFCSDLHAMIDHIRHHFAQSSKNVETDEGACDRIIAFLHHLHEHYVERPVEESRIEETMTMLAQLEPLKEDAVMNKILHGVYLWLVRNCYASNISYVEMLHQGFRAEKYEETAEGVIKKYMDRTRDKNVFIRDALMFSSNPRDSYVKIMERLNGVGAVRAFLYTFEKPITHRFGDRFPNRVSWTFQSYSYGENVFGLPGEEQRMSTAEVFHNQYLWQDRQHTLVAATLYSAETQYGIALFEPKDKDFLEELEVVTFQLSSAVRTLDMLKQQEELLGKQERLLDELHTTNLALDQMSKVDELTKVYNRKGFYPAADALIRDPSYQGKPVIVCYADMDDLKMVNDTYGHAEGDFAIKLAAQCLVHAFGEGAVIGRMGGDEFAAIIPASSDVTMEGLVARKEAFIQRLNEAHEKPYPFGLSTGMLACVCGDSYDLKAALDKADDLLYMEKKEKKKKAIREP